MCGEKRMMKFNLDDRSFSKTYYLDRNIHPLKFKKNINNQKLLEQEFFKLTGINKFSDLYNYI